MKYQDHPYRVGVQFKSLSSVGCSIGNPYWMVLVGFSQKKDTEIVLPPSARDIPSGASHLSQSDLASPLDGENLSVWTWDIYITAKCR